MDFFSGMKPVACILEANRRQANGFRRLAYMMHPRIGRSDMRPMQCFWTFMKERRELTAKVLLYILQQC